MGCHALGRRVRAPGSEGALEVGSVVALEPAVKVGVEVALVPDAVAARAASKAALAAACRSVMRDRSELDRDLGHQVGRLVDLRADAELLLDLLLDLVGEVGVVLEEGAGVLLALAQLVAVVGVSGAVLADEPVLDIHVDEAALTRDALAVQDVELGLLERR